MPRYGFNFQWIFHAAGQPPASPDLRALDFMAAHDLSFVRIPADYRHWVTDFDYFHPDEQVLKYFDQYLQACRVRGLHMCLNLHRAPGYCINGNAQEKHNLWQDTIAQDAFVFHWELFARRYKGVPKDSLSFDLVNEPPQIGEYGMTRENHAALMRRTVAAIRAIDPAREIVIDGLGGGNLAMPELVDLGVVHSGRGYQPMPVTHYRAAWWAGSKGLSAPVYPGTPWEQKTWDQETLRAFYAPWREVESRGVAVHIGEFGCYNKTSRPAALAWFRDILNVFHEFGWGYALWQFEGPFGLASHGRRGARYECVQGFKIDHEMLKLFLQFRR